MKETNELLPCPFCGGEPLLIEGFYDYDGGDRWNYQGASVRCSCGCILEIPNKSDEYLPLNHALDFAYKAWNTRAERITTRNGKHKTKYGRKVPLCECCGYAIGDSRYNYCPNCGAKVVDA